MCVAEFVELEKFRRECLAACVALAFVGVDVNPQSLCHGGILGRMRVAREGGAFLVSILSAASAAGCKLYAITFAAGFPCQAQTCRLGHNMRSQFARKPENT